jgi:hypothetical protein
MATMMQEKIIKDQPKEAEEDKWSRLFTDTVDLEHIEVDEQTAASYAGADGVCCLCGKQSDPSHNASKRHMQHVRMMVALDGLVGKSPLRRLFQGYPGDTNGELTQEGMKAWWGAELELLPSRLVLILKEQGGLELKLSRSTTTMKVDFEHIAGVSLGVVNYSPSDAKYSRACVQPWACVPISQSFARGCDACDVALDSQQAWWPVCMVQFSAEATKLVESTIGDADHEHTIRVGRSQSVWAVCIYQATERPPIAWKIRYAPWSGPLRHDEADEEVQDLPPPPPRSGVWAVHDPDTVPMVD